MQVLDIKMYAIISVSLRAQQCLWLPEPYALLAKIVRQNIVNIGLKRNFPAIRSVISEFGKPRCNYFIYIVPAADICFTVNARLERFAGGKQFSNRNSWFFDASLFSKYGSSSLS